ncbi:MAG: hypothetical protein HOV80_26120 [Polyangiaceae bacterium]|nr:hypothetical protein [Polyangiaceae bacterium]
MAEASERLVTVIKEPWHSRPSSREALRLIAKMVAGLAVLGVAVSIAAHFFRDELGAFGREIVEMLGVPGMALGTMLADGLHFPIPPQFYMVAAISAGTSQAAAIAAIAAGSVAGGHVAFYLAQKAGKLQFIQRQVRKVQKPLATLLEIHGTRAIVVGSLLPIPYAHLCYLMGLNRMRYRSFALLCALRIPKLLLYYSIVRFGWGS